MPTKHPIGKKEIERHIEKNNSSKDDRLHVASDHAITLICDPTEKTRNKEHCQCKCKQIVKDNLPPRAVKAPKKQLTPPGAGFINTARINKIKKEIISAKCKILRHHQSLRNIREDNREYKRFLSQRSRALLLDVLKKGIEQATNLCRD